MIRRLLVGLSISRRFTSSHGKHLEKYTVDGSHSLEKSSLLKVTPPHEHKVSFYRRSLPPFLTAFNSPEGRSLFREAMDRGHVENYFDLVGNFTSQNEPAYCGLGTLAMILNSLEVDPGRTWKGVWRWYSDEMLECCSPLDVVKEKGLTFEQFSCLATCHGLLTEAFRHSSAARSNIDKIGSLDQFRADLLKSATTPGMHLVVSFDRGTLGQTGHGHFSPIGAVHLQSDRALVLDVARFKYPSYWAPIEKLWQAMEPIDPDTNLPRGYFKLRLAHPRFTGCP